MKKIGIIGGGVAGINSAFHLVNNGYDVDLHESRENIGGRINSFIDSKMDDEIDNGQHILIGAYKEFLKLLEGLGTIDLLKFQKSLLVNYYNNKGEKAKLDTGLFLGNFGMLIGLLNLNFLNFKEKLSTISFVMKLKLKLLKSENKTILELLKQQNQSDNLIKCFWEPMILATMNTKIDICDAKLFINVLEQGFFAGRENARIIIPKVGLCNLINPIISHIQNSNGNVFFKSTISEVNISNQKVIIKNTDGVEFVYDEIIIAITPDRISKIKGLDLPWLNEFSFSPIISIYLWFEKEFLAEDFASILGTNIQWIFNKRKISNEMKDNSLVSITISGADDFIELGNKDLVEICEKELRQIFPKLEKNNLLHYRIIKEKNATLLAKLGLNISREKIDSLNNRIHFAGCWTDTGLPSTLEGAALSGFKIVKKIIS